MFLHWNDFNLKENKKEPDTMLLDVMDNRAVSLGSVFSFGSFISVLTYIYWFTRFYYACQCLFCFIHFQIVLHVLTMVIPSDRTLFSGLFLELHLMFSLMDKVPSGIEPMLKDLEEHIVSAGLADMVAAAETITTVGILLCTIQDGQI